jgi:predicted thioesterase
MEISQEIRVGIGTSEEFLVEDQHSAPHVGSGTVRVLATPWMIAFMEITARKMLDTHLAPELTSVGTHVDVRHLAAAKLGSSVRASVEIIAMEGRRITLSVRALVGEKEIGSGQHERVIVDKAKFLARLDE